MIQKIILGLINLVLGSMVLLSYHNGVNSLKAAGKDPNILWGGVPAILQPMIVVFMFLGALGYFFFTYNFLFNVSTDQLFFKRFSYWSLHLLYLLVFIPSMLWIGQTIKYIDTGTMVDWALVVTMLLTVAMASIFLFLFTIDLRVEKNTFMYLASVIGAAVFTFHTLFLDGLIWISFFHKTN